MTTPSPSDDPPIDFKSKVDLTIGDDVTDPHTSEHAIESETLHIESTADVFVGNLSPEEQTQANAALDFLTDVRTAVREAQDLPESIGRYRVMRSLGRGGFAEVFLAHDPELDRQVALKIPLFHADLNLDARQRFEREARVAASLGHPQIVPVYEYGNIGPLRFIAFAWCGGPSLAEWIQQQGASDNGVTDFRTAALIVAHLADAVQHAHQRGIVHRDLKPGNILIDDEAKEEGQAIWDQVRIADFGLARQINVQDTTLTRDGQIIGTPAYMAPEQASGDFDAGPTADVWALGMILFELLTGKTPFKRKDLLTTIRAICDEPLPDTKSSRPDIPAGLDAITNRCLQKNPVDRYGSAHELAEDLRRWLNGEPVNAKPVSAFSKAVLWSRRNPLLATSMVATLMSLMLGLGLSLWQWNVAVQNLQIAQQQTNRADDNLQTAQMLIRDIVQLEKKLQQQAALAPERNALIKRAAELQLRLVADEQQTAEVRFDTAVTLRELSTLLFQLGDTEASIKASKHVLALLEGLDDDLPEGKSAADVFLTRFQQRLRMATVLGAIGNTDDALALYQKNQNERVPDSVDMFRKATILAENLRAQSVLYGFNGDHGSSVAALKKALLLFEEIDPPDAKEKRWDYFLTVCRLQTSLLGDQIELGALVQAKACLQTAQGCIPELEKILPNHPVLVESAGMLAWQGGSLFEKTKQFGRAIEHYEKCRAVHLKLFQQNPAVSNPANIYVLASLALARTHVSNDSLEQAIAVADETTRVASEFPEALTASQAFMDNMKAMQELKSGAP